jgi:glycosyltransferase involved in cell wall biosynthesis
MAAARVATGALAERIHILGEVPYADVRSYYAGATLFVFPSYLETFGHPLIEAMATRVPVVASGMPVFREIAGDAALYADPHDKGSISRAMEAALEPSRREELVGLGAERVRKYTWESTVERLLRLFEEVLEDRCAG